MQNENTIKIIDIVAQITQEMMTNQSNNSEDLKLLLLIIYNECFQNDAELDPILKSYLTVALHRFITIENNNQVDTVESVIIPEDTTTTNYNNDETFMTTKLNEDIIQRLVHNRAPQLAELM